MSSLFYKNWKRKPKMKVRIMAITAANKTMIIMPGKSNRMRTALDKLKKSGYESPLPKKRKASSMQVKIRYETHRKSLRLSDLGSQCILCRNSLADRL